MVAAITPLKLATVLGALVAGATITAITLGVAYTLIPRDEFTVKLHVLTRTCELDGYALDFGSYTVVLGPQDESVMKINLNGATSYTVRASFRNCSSVNGESRAVQSGSTMYEYAYDGRVSFQIRM